MIEKLKKQNTWGECLEKLNEVIDAVNRLEESVQGVVNNSIADGGRIRLLQEQIHALKTRSENAQPDPYAEQHKWIGKLCRFWDDDAFLTSKDWAFGILTSIDKGMQYQYCCNENCNFKHCEPVLPTDNTIYKGGDND